MSPTKRENQTHNKSETPEQVSSEDSLKNGHTSKGLKASEARRLGHIFRSERCVYARSNVLETQNESEIHSKQKMLQIQIVMLRSNLCANGVYQIGSRSSSTFTTTKCKTTIVSGRLVSFEPSKNVSGSMSREMPKSADLTRLHIQNRRSC